MKSLFIEGIYRKSGSLAVVKKMRNLIEQTDGNNLLINGFKKFCLDPERISFDDVQAHVMTTLVKSFFRELTEPLITFELYENFINVSGLNY